LIGLIGLLFFLAILVRVGIGASARSPLVWAAWLGVFAWFFPINTHTALYSAFWSLLLGWMVAVVVSQPRTPDMPAERS